MAKIRIYELAKELDIPSKRIIQLLAGIGVEVKNHMSTIDEDKALKIKAHLKGEERVVDDKIAKTETKLVTESKAKNDIIKKSTESTLKTKKETKKEKIMSRKEKKAEKEAQKKLEKNKSKKVIIEGQVSPKSLAEIIGVDVSNIMTRLVDLGVMSTINENLDVDIINLLTEEFGVDLELREDLQEKELLSSQEEDDPKQLKNRPPVVTVLGHVDHGKTSLLDAVREANVTAKEAGGITQHIGAYQATINSKKITFLDTPGHEAFTAMRARGAKATDIVILVVAADDGVMPQTIEAINHAKAAEVPIIVAVNKMDKENANPDKAKQQLAEYDLIPEEWGGDTIFVHVSALKKEGLDDLLEMVLLVSEMAELKANPSKKAQGTVIEAKLDKGRGAVATVLITDGTLHIGDPIICGSISGKVRAMADDKGKRIKKAGPASPVEVLGLSDIPDAGDMLQVVDDEKLARQIAEKRSEKRREFELKKNQKVTLEEFFTKIQEGEAKDLNIIIKADVRGSVEALRESLLKLDTDNVKLNVIHSGVGAITESDVMLASASDAIIIGFNVRPSANVRKIAEKEEVEIRLYRVIYEAIEDIKKAMKGMLDPEFREEVLGQAEARQLFKVSKVGTIAGCYVLDGKITRQAQVRIIRDGVVVHEGLISSLKRFKDDTKEVQSGFECGIMLERYNDIQEGDIIEAFIMKKVEIE